MTKTPINLACLVLLPFLLAPRGCTETALSDGTAERNKPAGFMAAKNSTLKTTVEHGPDKQIVLQFQVIPNKGILVTDEGPWSLTLRDTTGLALRLDEKSKAFTLRTYDQKIPGFRVPTTTTGSSGTLSYRLRAFVCREDKTRCFPEIHKGKLTWQASTQPK